MTEIENYLLDDYKDTDDYLKKFSRGGLSLFPPLIITCAITGANHGKEANINLPETPEEQAQQTYDAYKAGASIVHVHRRSSENQAVMTANPDEYKEVNALIREKCPDLIINNTAACGRVRTMDGKIGPLMLTSITAEPEIASFDISNFAIRTKFLQRKPPLSGRDEDTTVEISYSLTPSEAEGAARLMREHKIKPEYEIYDIGDLVYLKQLVKAGLVEGPHLIQMVFNMAFNFPTADYMSNLIRCCPKNSLLSCIGVGAIQFPIVTMAMIMGLHVRVGMEDNIYMERGVLAESNAQLVEKVVRIARELGRPIATPAQARQMLSLGAPRDFQYSK